MCVGDKSRAQLARTNAKQILFVGNEIGRLPPQFGDASRIASQIINSEFDYDVMKIFYNQFRSVVSYKTSEIPMFSLKTVENAEKITIYDSLDSDVLQSYMEYSLASLIYYCMKEGACSEQSSRMTAMDNSSKNAGTICLIALKLCSELNRRYDQTNVQIRCDFYFAGEMIDKLTLSYNRTRQAVITGELIEIISGAAAL